MAEDEPCWKRTRRCFTYIGNCIKCSCLKKSNNNNIFPNSGQRDSIIRLPGSQRMDLIVTGMMPAERWTSTPTYIGFIPPLPPPLPTPDITRKRRSSPGRLDVSTIERIKSELQATENKVVEEDT